MLDYLKPIAVSGAFQFSTSVRDGVFANARHIFGSTISDEACAAFTHEVIGHFYDFVVDVGRSSALSAAELRGKIESVEGREAYLAHRRRGRGAIILTAHMGAFEVGLAALTEVEPHVHVVFKRDALDGFETIRSSLRHRLGIHEAAIDDGWTTWLRLRDALKQNQVVVMQGDRAMPKQKARAVPMFGSAMSLPLGPMKLAQMSGSPIFPVFTVRTRSGGCRLFVEPPIDVGPDAKAVEGVEPALLQIGNAIEKIIAAYPEQWLVLESAFVENSPAATLRNSKT